MKKILIVAMFVIPAFCCNNAFAGTTETKCKINFTMKSWSAFYQTGKGSGTIECDNGQTAKVKLKSHGGGVTFGKREVLNGHGTFSAVANIDELFGSYANTTAHAGAVKSASAQAMTKGEVSLALTGTGKGFDLGFAFGSFKITKE